jgi:hypothetical protein
MLPPLGIYIERERGKTGDVLTELFWRIYSVKIWPFGGFRKDEWPSLLAPRDKIVPLIAFGRMFLVELSPRSSWLNQETSVILTSYTL